MAYCFVVGNEIVSAFEVTCQAGTSVSNLRDIIYEKNKNYFKEIHVDANKLYLWKVDIPYNNPKLKTLESRFRDINEEDTTIQELGGTKLTPFENIDDIFARNVSKKIRIISTIDNNRRISSVLTSFYFTALVSPMHVIPDGVKIEIKNKVIKTFPHMNILSIDQLIDALALIWDIEALESGSTVSQNDPYVELRTAPSFFKISLPRGITERTFTNVDLCLPSYNKSGENYHNPFYNDPQFRETVSFVEDKIKERPKDIIVLAGVSGGGKTSTTFGIAMQRWSIYIDFSPIIGYYGVHLITELEEIRRIKPKFELDGQQIDAFRMLNIAILSRGLLLIKMFIEEKVSTPKEWLLAQLQMNDSETRSILRLRKYDPDTTIILIKKINACLKLANLTLILDESQVLCSSEYGKYKGSNRGKSWNLLQGYVAHLLQFPVTCLLAGTYMHMASGISLITSVGKDPNLQTHIVLKLPFLSPDDVLRNLDAVIDLEHVKTETRELLGNLLMGRPRNCASFVRLLISTPRSNGKTKDQVLRELIPLWQHEICSSMADYLANACEYFGADNLHSEKAIMDVLRHRVFYHHEFKEAIELLQHSIIPCQSPVCIVLKYNSKIDHEIEINSSFESYLIDSIKLFLEQKRNKKMIDVFVDNIIMLNNVTSIGNEFDAVFITAIIEKRNRYIREELDKWKNGQQFDLPSWITPTMKFITTSNLSDSVHITQYVKNIMTYSSYAIQPEQRSGSDVVLSLMDDKQNVVLLSVGSTVSSSVSIKKKKVKDQLIKSCLRFQYIECPTDRKKKPKRLKISLNADLPKDDINYQISDFSKHNQINTFIKNRKHIYVSVELPRRAGKRSGKRTELFRLNEYGDLVIIVDDRNIKHVFGETIERLVENLRRIFSH
ncbi:810_t:CDS:2 [Funneliformis mosseae]|uniref:810_t:CDS:1 n=1 Tax=Funneliformis mosseae TaxID=27381 RepID=A0A9N9BKD9_FUNMO|nr:810_t:CDS:2 [Funneliformis mosseae]